MTDIKADWRDIGQTGGVPVPGDSQMSAAEYNTHAAQTNTNTDDLAGKLDTPTGTPDGTKFARDDGTWAVPAGGGGGTPTDGSVTFPKLAPAAVVTASETIAANLNDTTIPTSAAVQAAITAAVTALLNGAPGALDTLKELADAINDDASFAASITTALAGKQPLDSDLTTLAGLTATTDSFIQSKSGAWSARTVAQVKTDLGLSGTNTGDQTSVSGNAGTATALATPRNINGVAFDGTANITVADSTKLPTAAVVDNADGTIAVGSVTGMEPLPVAAAIITANTAPVIGKTTYYNASGGNLAPPMPALAGLSVGARLAVRRDPAEVSANTVTFALSGGDTFYSSGATSFTLPIGGEQREFQVVQPGGSGTKYWAPAGSLNPIAGLGRVFGTQNRGNVGIWFGDSIGTAGDMIVGSANLVDPTIRSESTFTWASVLSGQRLRYLRNASKGGDNAATAMARWTTDVAPYNFSVLIWALGTNDSFLQTTVAAYAAQVKEAHARTRAKGADFIICTVPPNDNLSNNPANRKSLIVQYNQFLRDYAAKWGLILIDMFDLLADTSGNYASGYSTDKTHPVALGYRAMGALVADTLALYLPPFSAPLPRTTTDANLVTEPLFLGGLNGSFVPTGWSMPGGVLRTGVTASLVTSDTTIKGNWFKMVMDSSFSSPQTIFQTISSGITAGRQYRFLGRVRLLNPVGITVTARIAYDGNFDYTGDATNTHEFRAMSGLGGAIDDGVFWFDSVAPVSASTAQINLQVVGSTGTGEVHLAQIGVYDITDVQAAL